MYEFYLDKLLLPVAPSKLTLKVKNQNKTVVLINDGEINILRKAGLTEIDFTALIPQFKYPFAKYKNGFKTAEYYLNQLEKLKTDTDGKGNFKPFQFIVSRVTPDGKLLFDSNMKVALEDYQIEEDAKEGLDLNVKIKLKQFIPYSTKTIKIVESSNSATSTESPKAEVTKERTAENNPTQKTYTVVKGDSLWAIAQKMMGNGSDYPKLYSANQSIIDARNKGTGNPKYTIYPNQVFTIP